MNEERRTKNGDNNFSNIHRWMVNTTHIWWQNWNEIKWRNARNGKSIKIKREHLTILYIVHIMYYYYYYYDDESYTFSVFISWIQGMCRHNGDTMNNFFRAHSTMIQYIQYILFHTATAVCTVHEAQGTDLKLTHIRITWATNSWTNTHHLIWILKRWCYSAPEHKRYAMEQMHDNKLLRSSIRHTFMCHCAIACAKKHSQFTELQYFFFFTFYLLSAVGSQWSLCSIFTVASLGLWTGHSLPDTRYTTIFHYSYIVTWMPSFIYYSCIDW